MKIIAVIAAFLFTSNSIAQKSDTPRQLQEGVYLKDGGVIDSMYTRCILVSVKRSMWGYKHLFIADSGDSLQIYYQKRLKLNECYKVPKKL